MAKMSDFLNHERKIIATIKSPTGDPINVYSITSEIADKVIELNQRIAEASRDEEDMVYYSGKEMLKYIFPLFTDLQHDLPDESLAELAENPPFQLVQVQNVVRKLLVEINQAWADSMESQLGQFETMMNQLETAKKTQENIEKVQGLMDELNEKSKVKPAPTSKPRAVIAKKMDTQTEVHPTNEGKTLLQNGMTVDEVNDAIMKKLVAQKSK